MRIEVTIKRIDNGFLVLTYATKEFDYLPLDRYFQNFDEAVKFATGQIELVAGRNVHNGN